MGYSRNGLKGCGVYFSARFSWMSPLSDRKVPSYGRKPRPPRQWAYRMMRVCDVNRHQERWEGRDLEVTSTELRWTGQEAGKNRVILTKGRNASCHQRAGPTRRNLKEFLISRFTRQSAVRKKMAAVHFTTIPFEPNTANYTKSHNWGWGAKFVPVIATLPILGFKFIKLFCVFLWAINLWFSCAKNCG